ncbi:MAG TPA: AMP-binding protein, partial [Myxococcota bacterium]|nr:AMP-binding protein [Myxococcota bacterium]
MTEFSEALDRWRRERDAFRWSVPDPFNFGRDVVDRFAADPARPALLWRDAAGAERRLGFGDVRAGSNRAAHLLAHLGVQPGEPVLVMLPRVPEWQLVLVGALKAGALIIPSSTILRPKDIAYRIRHSGAVAIVTTA